MAPPLAAGLPVCQDGRGWEPGLRQQTRAVMAPEPHNTFLPFKLRPRQSCFSQEAPVFPDRASWRSTLHLNFSVMTRTGEYTPGLPTIKYKSCPPHSNIQCGSNPFPIFSFLQGGPSLGVSTHPPDPITW